MNTKIETLLQTLTSGNGSNMRLDQRVEFSNDHLGEASVENIMTAQLVALDQETYSIKIRLGSQVSDPEGVNKEFQAVDIKVKKEVVENFLGLIPLIKSIREGISIQNYLINENGDPI